jgi:hypothetical protein
LTYFQDLSRGEKENKKTIQIKRKSNVSISKFGDRAVISQTFKTSVQKRFFQFES